MIQRKIYVEWILLPQLFGQVHFQYLLFFIIDIFVGIPDFNATSSAASDLGQVPLWDTRHK